MLGSKVKHRVSGFSGIVTSVLKNLHGPNRVQVTAETLSGDGKPLDYWFYVEEVDEIAPASTT